VVNKVYAASDLALAKLRRALPAAQFVSAHTGQGIDALRGEWPSWPLQPTPPSTL
jgi:GTPase